MFSGIFQIRCPNKFVTLSAVLILFSAVSWAQGRYGYALEKKVIYNSSSLSGDLYSGIDNYLKIDDSLKAEHQSLFLISTNGIVERDTSDGFLAIPEKPGKVRLTLYAVEDIDTVTLGYKFFNVRRVPDPRIKIDNVLIPVRGQVKKSFLMSARKLTVHVSDDITGSENWIQVIDFTLGYNYGGFHVSYLNASDKMLPGTIDILNTLGPDREISIKVTAESEGGVQRILPISRLMIY